MALFAKATTEDASMQSSSLPSTPRVRKSNKISKKVQLLI